MTFEGIEISPIPGFPDYAASKCGKICSLPRKFRRQKIWLSQKIHHKDFYPTVNVRPKPRIKKTIATHRLIAATFLGLDLNSSMEVDHIDRDPTNNNVANLRIASSRQNNQNQAPRSQFKGVHKSHNDKKWQACIKHHRKKILLGRFSCPTQAARAYDRKAKELFGEFAYLNFPNGDPFGLFRQVDES